MIRAILCRLGLHAWTSNLIRHPAMSTAYRVRACVACHARRVDAVAVGGAS